VHSVACAMAYEEATKEESSRNSQADNSRPSESKGICSDGSVVSVGVKNIASFDKCDSIGVMVLVSCEISMGGSLTS
jgi:hypothetical protein